MLQTRDITLRDFTEADIETRIRWETVETEWQLWDGPWEYEGLTEAERRVELELYAERMRRWVEQYRDMPPEKTRYTFQIETNEPCPRYIGWVSAYCIDGDYCYTSKPTSRCAVGIDIPDMAARGKGYGCQALCLFIRYLLSRGEERIFTQTWSGNERMIHVAQKIGFEECCRKKNFRTVRGEKYDGLTFALNRQKFEDFCLL